MGHKKDNNTLFIVDDESNILLSLERMLRNSGYEINTFNDPLIALERLKETQVGVVVADQCMPQMRGDEFLSLVSDIQPHIKSIVLSGYSPEALDGLAKSEFRAWRYLAKPCDDEELRQSVKEAFELFNEAQCEQ